MIMKTAVFSDVMICSVVEVSYISEEHTASIFRAR
jgi:hypothetical protein